MIKFTIGIAILAFTSIVGSFQYFENIDEIIIKERALVEAKEKRDRYQTIEDRAKKVRKISLAKGEDKKNTIERMLNIGAPGLTFEFIGQSKQNQGVDAIYNHNFRIEGPAEFTTLMETLKTLRETPGFVVSKVCYGCKSGRKAKMEEGQHHAIIEGQIYVYDPKLL